MKIIGILPTSLNNHMGALVELSGSEVSLLKGGNASGYTGRLDVGDVIDISERVRALLRLEDAVSKAKNVGVALSAMADAINSVVEKATAAITPIDPEKLPSDGVLN